MIRDNIRLIESGVDYVTLTSHKSCDTQKLYAIGTEIFEYEHRLGNAVREYAPHGYKGHGAGRCFVGRGEQGVMLRVSGDLAQYSLDRLVQLDVNCTRIDLQVTVQTPEYDQMFGYDSQRDALRRRATWGERNLAHIRHILGNGKGDTTNIGSRSSPRYGRLYDKQCESGEARYTRAWRYEVEYKQECARSAWQKFREVFDSENLARNYVSNQFATWGFSVGHLGVGDCVAVGPRKTQTDVRRKLEWIEKQVLPSMAFIRDNGGGMELQNILGQLKLDV